MRCDWMRDKVLCGDEAGVVIISACTGEHFVQFAACPAHDRAYTDAFANHLMACGECVQAVGVADSMPIRIIQRKEVLHGH